MGKYYVNCKHFFQLTVHLSTQKKGCGGGEEISPYWNVLSMMCFTLYYVFFLLMNMSGIAYFIVLVFSVWCICTIILIYGMIMQRGMQKVVQ